MPDDPTSTASSPRSSRPFTADGAAVDHDALAAHRRAPDRRRRRRPRARRQHRRVHDAQPRRAARARRGHDRGGRRPRPGRRRHRRALDARDRRAQRARRARRRGRGDDRAAVLRRALAGASCSPTTRAVAERISIPIMYYNLPSATGRDARRRPVPRAAARGGRDLAQGHRRRRGRGDRARSRPASGPTLLNGWDTLTFAALAAGVRAVVWGTASILPEQCVAAAPAADRRHRPARRARAVGAGCGRCAPSSRRRATRRRSRRACALVGDTTGPTRAPLLPLDDDATAELAAAARARGRADRRARGSPALNQVNQRGWALRTAAMAARTRSSAAARAASTVASSSHGSAIPALSPASPSRTPSRQNGL